MTVSRVVATVLSILALVSPANAQDLGDPVSAPGVFSYQAPQGWKTKDLGVSKYPVIFGAPKDGFAPNINVILQTYPKPMAEYVEINKSQLKSVPILQNVVIVDEKPFQTATGLAGTRLVITDTVGKSHLEQTFYFFQGPSDGKFVITASCLVGDAKRYAPIFDASMKSFTLK